MQTEITEKMLIKITEKWLQNNADILNIKELEKRCKLSPTELASVVQKKRKLNTRKYTAIRNYLLGEIPKTDKVFLSRLRQLNLSVNSIDLSKQETAENSPKQA